MRLIDSYTVVVTEATEECRDYFAKWFGFEVAFEASWFVLMTHPRRTPTVVGFHAAGPSIGAAITAGARRRWIVPDAPGRRRDSRVRPPGQGRSVICHGPDRRTMG